VLKRDVKLQLTNSIAAVVARDVNENLAYKTETRPRCRDRDYIPGGSSCRVCSSQKSTPVSVRCSCSLLTANITLGHSWATIGVSAMTTIVRTKVIRRANSVTSATSTTTIFYVTSGNSISTVTSVRRMASPMNISG